MGHTVRYYLFASDGIKRLSRRLLDGLVAGSDAMPQYANTKQRLARVVLKTVDGKPAEIVDYTGEYFRFDAGGEVRDDLQQAAFEALSFGSRSLPVEGDKVVSIEPSLDRKKWRSERRWEPTKEDLDLIAGDIWKRGKPEVPKVDQAKGTAPKRPPLTYEARNAMSEIRAKISNIEFELDGLSEPALKGLVFEADRLSKEGAGDFLMEGLAKFADRQREILARHRTGRGAWFAVVEVVRWDGPRKNQGTSDIVAQRKCPSLKEARQAARELLKENAKYFDERNTIETNLYCELEWSEDDE